MYFPRAVERLKKHRKTKTEDFHRPHLRNGCPRGQLYLQWRLKVIEGRRLLQVRVEVGRSRPQSADSLWIFQTPDGAASRDNDTCDLNNEAITS